MYGNLKHALTFVRDSAGGSSVLRQEVEKVPVAFQFSLLIEKKLVC